jgi:tRNA 2-selenouridine synthase
MPTKLSLEDFLSHSGEMADVRSPSEYNHAHIPGSFSLPLFSDQERALVGTTYKQKSREAAIDLGLKITGPKLYDLVQLGKARFKLNEGKFLCWRGGMRSGFVARLFESIGFSSVTLDGGYQSFRRSALQALEALNNTLLSFRILGGLTGTGKTLILQELRKLGAQVIDLENLANHRGSAFGQVGLTQQPSQEHFENLLAYELKRMDPSYPVWIEDENRVIGTCAVPHSLFRLMSNAPVFHIEATTEQRVSQLLTTYGNVQADQLVASTLKISKRLGSQLTKEVVNLLNQENKREAFVLLLSYYDKTYLHHLNRKCTIDYMENKEFSHRDWALHLKNKL